MPIYTFFLIYMNNEAQMSQKLGNRGRLNFNCKLKKTVSLLIVVLSLLLLLLLAPKISINI